MTTPPILSVYPILLGILVPTIFLQAPAISGQQTGTIRGRVESSVTNEALPGVRVILEQTGLEARTGKGGEFLLEGVPSGAARIRLESLPDYVTSTEQVVVRPGATIRVSMEMTPFAVVLEELHVKGTPSPSDAIVRVFAEGEARELTGGGTAVDLLAYSFSGIQVTRGSGAPGSGSRILIRGINSLSLPGDPLVFMDGVRMNGVSGPIGSEASHVLSFLDMIPADMVARIEVLKGPAATRFGVGSSNGVILIFTR